MGSGEWSVCFIFCFVFVYFVYYKWVRLVRGEWLGEVF